MSNKPSRPVQGTSLLRDFAFPITIWVGLVVAGAIFGGWGWFLLALVSVPLILAYHVFN